MEKTDNRTRRISVYVSQEELDIIRRMAGLVPVGTWIRHIALVDKGAYQDER